LTRGATMQRSMVIDDDRWIEIRRQRTVRKMRLGIDEYDCVVLGDDVVGPFDQLQIRLLGEGGVHAADDVAFDRDIDVDAGKFLFDQGREGETGSHRVGIGASVRRDEDVLFASEGFEQVLCARLAPRSLLHLMGGIGDGLDTGFDECGHRAQFDWG
jgi:hypothetical protein